MENRYYRKHNVPQSTQIEKSPPREGNDQGLLNQRKVVKEISRKKDRKTSFQRRVALKLFKRVE